MLRHMPYSAPAAPMMRRFGVPPPPASWGSPLPAAARERWEEALPARLLRGDGIAASPAGEPRAEGEGRPAAAAAAEAPASAAEAERTAAEAPAASAIAAAGAGDAVETRTREQLVAIARAVDTALTAHWSRLGMHVSVADGWARFFAEAGVGTSMSAASVVRAICGRLFGAQCRDPAVSWVTPEDVRALYSTVDAARSGAITPHEWQLRLFRLELERRSSTGLLDDTAQTQSQSQAETQTQPLQEEHAPLHRDPSAGSPGALHQLAKKAEVENAEAGETGELQAEGEATEAEAEAEAPGQDEGEEEAEEDEEDEEGNAEEAEPEAPAELEEARSQLAGGASSADLAASASRVQEPEVQPLAACSVTASPHATAAAPAPAAEAAREPSLACSGVGVLLPAAATQDEEAAALPASAEAPAAAPAAEASAAASSAPAAAAEAAVSRPRLRGKRSAGAAAEATPQTPAKKPRAASAAARAGAAVPTPLRQTTPIAEAAASCAAGGGDARVPASGHTLRPRELGQRVVVVGDGWGQGTGGYEAVITEADDSTFTVISVGGWEETHVLRSCCVPVAAGATSSPSSAAPAGKEAARRRAPAAAAAAAAAAECRPSPSLPTSKQKKQRQLAQRPRDEASSVLGRCRG
eukprot:TRINITY_DN6280_c0_g1_i1.p1 TRINITY_DN6280_c0_g1~~TRINITY_DN6280_c0_g1_i1.p1  ORF type:complete len:640 (+),score=197.17 TRINITY_DN6280_c0_g1_i1:58-1977(+)